VVGGGPAGATFALRMARLGYEVLLLERSTFPRMNIGEVLAPGTAPLLDALSLRDAIPTAGSLPTNQARVRWAGQRTVSLSIPPSQASVTVNRGDFDSLLLEAAKSAGVTVWQATRACHPKRTTTGWELIASTPTGPRRIRAGFLTDASGRGRLLGSSRTRRSVPTLALHATWRGTAEPGKPTRLEAGRKAWFWGVHLPGGQFRAFAIVPAAVFRQNRVTKANLEGYYRRLLAATEVMDALTQPTLDGPVSVCDATCYFDPDCVDETSIKLGDASFTVDPLSSSGVQSALRSSLTASAVVHTMLLPGGDTVAATAFYRDSQRFASNQHSHWAAAYHTKRLGRSSRGIEDRNAARADEPRGPRTQPHLGDVFARPARLAQGATLVDEPCISGDRVVRKRALSHPRLGRPVAYLGDIEIAPLVELLTQRETFGQAVWEWSCRITPAKALVLAAWLDHHSLIKY